MYILYKTGAKKILLNVSNGKLAVIRFKNSLPTVSEFNWLSTQTNWKVQITGEFYLNILLVLKRNFETVVMSDNNSVNCEK